MLSRHYVAAQHLDTVRRHAPNARVVFDTVDLHFLREERLAAIDGGTAATISAHTKRAEELALIAKADVTVVVSQTEQAMLKLLAPTARVVLVSNVHALSPSVAPWGQRRGIVFIGGFRHPPNVDAMLWYAREVLVHEFLPRQGVFGVAPIRRRCLPRTIVLEQRVEVVEIGFLVERRDDDRLTLPLPDRVHDLVLQDSRQPGLDARPAGEPYASPQCSDERLLNDVLGSVRVAQLKLGDTQQVPAVSIQLGSEVRSVQRVPSDNPRRE